MTPETISTDHMAEVLNMPAGDAKILYIVLYRTVFGDKWECDGIYDSRPTAEAKLKYEELLHPKWKHALVEAEVRQ